MSKKVKKESTPQLAARTAMDRAVSAAIRLNRNPDTVIVSIWAETEDNRKQVTVIALNYKGRRIHLHFTAEDEMGIDTAEVIPFTHFAEIIQAL